ncbi:hypothetical protein [Coxiella burnetii]|uniref:Uncharacterized protein n=1 Tax=Coxiella burnetii (strain Dugway 5J108-111) TaxID=434922 RepID=B5XHR6_COXBN|nr:hypothetical protein [Coxiella burnetii]ACI23096.1 hypothetical protein CBUD_0381a [Coxiella burnetii Dugway 5J108-111]ACJ20957.1 hypothetical protein CbuK_1837 [Coxiella burnetii CbuK_Q154]ATN86528.1 hypothetical protein AYO29_08970 [Coxiella burnetii str. Schperling]EAX33550.1 hypothetical protein A35_09370 [Coxiella burnetii 'MSU Goat Q177']OYK80856.1 hypothetical protein CbuD7E6568_01965 [Coxiella burnetii]
MKVTRYQCCNILTDSEFFSEENNYTSRLFLIESLGNFRDFVANSSSDFMLR